MGSDANSVQVLVSDDTVSPIDLAEFKKEQIEIIASNMCEPKDDRIDHHDQRQTYLVNAVPKPGFAAT